MAVLLLVTVAIAAGPTASPGASNGGGGNGAAVQAMDAVADLLGLTRAQVQEQRQDGQSLAQIAAARNVDVQKLIDALTAQWRERIDTRVQNGALTAAEATQLKSQLELRAKAMVEQAAPGGMRGAAVGAGPAAGNGAGPGAGTGTGQRGSGTGTCDGTGPHGAGQS